MELKNLDFLYKKDQLSSHETVLDKWSAAIIVGGILVHPGQIVLTNSRVIFYPMSTDIPLMIGQAVDAITRVPMFKVLGAACHITEKIVSIPLDQIERVESIGKPNLLNKFGAKVIITLRDHSRHQFDFYVSDMRSRLTTILPQTIIRKNSQVREDFIQAISRFI